MVEATQAGGGCRAGGALITVYIIHGDSCIVGLPGSTMRIIVAAIAAPHRAIPKQPRLLGLAPVLGACEDRLDDLLRRTEAARIRGGDPLHKVSVGARLVVPARQPLVSASPLHPQHSSRDERGLIRTAW